MLSTPGILGLILAVVGVFGVISYAANQRTHEIGIRLALGAQPLQILKMILRQGFIIVGAGVLAGTLAAAGMARLVANLLFGVPPGDTVTYHVAVFVTGIAWKPKGRLVLDVVAGNSIPKTGFRAQGFLSCIYKGSRDYIC